MATRVVAGATAPSARGRDDEGSGSATICIGKYIYTQNTGPINKNQCIIRSIIPPMKARRQAAILELVDRDALRSQEQLRRRLHRRGFDATQATISRDIKELGLVKRSGDGAYQRLGLAETTPAAALAALERAATEFLQRVDHVQQLVVIRTGIGQAQPLAIAIDRAQLSEAVGTIGGDDTILVVARDVRRAAALTRRLERLAGR